MLHCDYCKKPAILTRQYVVIGAWFFKVVKKDFCSSCNKKFLDDKQQFIQE